MELIVKNVCKSIRRKEILTDINLQLCSGKIYGFMGKNGSGKTMLFRALSGLISIDSGTISWNGKMLHKDFSILPNLGITIENAGLYPKLTGVQNLLYLADLTHRIGKEEINKAITRVGLDPQDKRTFGKYSMGMKQRLSIAQAIMEKPDIIMLDEPTNGLDKSGVEEIRKIMLEEKERGALILLASHSEEDMRLLADQIYEMENGHIVR
ncbi:MAG: ATP-binding cassette domain-containing protein [Lachnospiraceae bacterium]|nr:ATP-binding cassette domain-containing protein [Lachnospiraceae bacterium]